MSETIRVLFVDDEQNIRNALRRMFRRQGWQLEFAASGAEALELFERGTAFDVVVTDQRMPGMSGVELLKELRQRSPGTVRMILSAYTDADTVLDAINEGYVYKFLTKSCSDTVLKEAVCQVVESVRLAREHRRLSAQVALQDEEIAAVDWLAGEFEEVDLGPGDTEFGKLAFDAAPLGLVLVDGSGRVLAANREACEVLGDTTPAGLVGKPWNPATAEGAGAIQVTERPCVGPSPGTRVLALWPTTESQA